MSDETPRASVLIDETDNNIKYRDVIKSLIDRKLTREEFNEEFKSITGVDKNIIYPRGAVITMHYNPAEYRFHAVYDENDKVIDGQFH